MSIKGGVDRYIAFLLKMAGIYGREKRRVHNL